ncbi:MAG TPA: transposase, partial [Gemmataceae bacterium]|nr:transposase [Gemmataceae bacterium]
VARSFLSAVDVRQARCDARAGRLSIEELCDLLEELDRLRGHDQETIRRLTGEINRLKERLGQYEPEVTREPTPGQSSEKPSLPYSLAAEEKRRRDRRRQKKSPGRRPTELKFAEAERFENVLPEGWRRQDCERVRERAVWRLQDGRAIRVGYRIYRGPGSDEPSIPGVTRRCEYGIEILVVLAYLVYVIGISLHKACAVLKFFCQLPLSRSQADALLRQLAQHWESEFDTLCDLLVYAAVVYTDDTGWKIGVHGCSLWTFATERLRLFKFGCRKDANTLESILPSDCFDGILVSDDAAVYRDRYARSQKCWAHLLRKAIRLAVLYPRKRRYRRFLDALLQLYYAAKRAAADGRLGEQGHKDRVADFEERLAGLCREYWPHGTRQPSPHEHEFANLVNELADRLIAEELFTFVLSPAVEATNNLSERLLRGAAQDRQLGRTSKTPAGAERRSVIVSILETLRVNLPEFTFASVVNEVRGWMEEGVSLLDKLWQAFVEAEPALVIDSS